MTIAYFDTSAAMKLLVQERETAALGAALAAATDVRLVASWLLHTELHCAAGRRPEALTLESVAQLLESIDLVDLTRGDMIAAAGHAPLRSNDAIHLAVAVRLGVDTIITYDEELASAAQRTGLPVLAPS